MTTNYNEFKITANYTGNKVAPWNEFNSNHHKVTVYDSDTKRHTSFDFWASIAHPVLDTEYDVLNAFYCFLSDAISGTLSFESFCSEFGYDTDSRSAERIWKTCKHGTEKFFRMSGYSLDMLYDLVNNLSDIAG